MHSLEVKGKRSEVKVRVKSEVGSPKEGKRSEEKGESTEGVGSTKFEV
jgi:hypothetical protein